MEIRHVSHAFKIVTSWFETVMYFKLKTYYTALVTCASYMPVAKLGLSENDKSSKRLKNLLDDFKLPQNVLY